MAVITPSTVKAKTLMTPALPGDAITDGLVSSAALESTRQSYTSSAVSLWNSGKFNTQGQKWAAAEGGNASAGCQNRATGRSVLDVVFFPHITEFEFVFAGDKFDVQMWGNTAASGMTTGFDLLVWIEVGDRMQRITPKPVGGSTTSMRYFNVDIGYHYQGRIKVAMGACLFVGIGHEGSAVVRPAPDRHFVIADGDSYFESQQSHNAGKPEDEEAYFCLTIPVLLGEQTGWTVASRAQGGTGFFRNGSGLVTSDAWGPVGSTRWFSAHRRNWMTVNGPGVNDFSNKPLFFILNGTWNDADVGGQTTMYARAKECYQWVVAQDPHIVMAHVSIEPYTGDAAGGVGADGTVTGKPTSGSPHHQNLLGHQQAAAEVQRTYVINPFGPTNPWWTGKGDITTRAATDPGSQQAAFVGSDHIHGTYDGYSYYATRIKEAIGELPVPLTRAQRQA